MKVIGIDPGKKGAMAIIDDANGEIYTAIYENTDYVEILKNHTDADFCILERVNAMPNQGVVSMFNFGQTYGWLQGVLDTLRIPYELVTPQKWKKEFSVTSDKNTSIEVAKRLFPTVSLHRTARSFKDDDNLAEALLMAEYGRRKHK